MPSLEPSSRSRCGIALTGVAVTTSRPNTASSISSGTAMTSPTAKINGRETAQPMSPPASRMASAPCPRPGAPQAMWTSPSTPMTRADIPMTMRPLASGFSG